MELGRSFSLIRPLTYRVARNHRLSLPTPTTHPFPTTPKNYQNTRTMNFTTLAETAISSALQVSFDFLLPLISFLISSFPDIPRFPPSFPRFHSLLLLPLFSIVVFVFPRSPKATQALRSTLSISLKLSFQIPIKSQTTRLKMEALP